MSSDILGQRTSHPTPVRAQDTHVTVWFVTAAHPAEAIAAAPATHVDRGFGRKYLAMLNPRWPITPIGEFVMNRSIPASPGEFYIGTFPGVTVVHTCLPTIERISQLPAWLVSSLPAADTYAIAWRDSDGFGAFAHLQGATVKRALSALPDHVLEDTGLPDPCEAPYWAGEHPNPSQHSRIALPFAPSELAFAAQTAWIGVDVQATHPAVPVAAFAVDGRTQQPSPPRPHLGTMVSAATAKLGLAPERDYDDYEDFEHAPLDELEAGLEHAAREWKQQSASVTARAGRALRRTRRAAAKLLGTAPPERRTTPRTPEAPDPEYATLQDLHDLDAASVRPTGSDAAPSPAEDPTPGTPHDTPAPTRASRARTRAASRTPAPPRDSAAQDDPAPQATPVEAAAPKATAEQAEGTPDGAESAYDAATPLQPRTSRVRASAPDDPSDALDGALGTPAGDADTPRHPRRLNLLVQKLRHTLSSPAPGHDASADEIIID
ncbi:hypothetical protein [Corynebacterium sp. 13CS0277]|uniref:DUF6928 family protein n=1 Tax=Corynebacterium sp. 13CS0277 TaxID=2071994 RepID=UPI0018ED4E3F|nr:hypothetical protein [Corynebacterium sp. 13CS0277]